MKTAQSVKDFPEKRIFVYSQNALHIPAA